MPSLWLASAGLAWVVFFRSNRIIEQLAEAMATLHKDARAERLAMLATIVRRPDPNDPDEKQMIDELLEESSRFSDEVSNINAAN